MVDFIFPSQSYALVNATFSCTYDAPKESYCPGEKIDYTFRAEPFPGQNLYHGRRPEGGEPVKSLITCEINTADGRLPCVAASGSTLFSKSVLGDVVKFLDPTRGNNTGTTKTSVVVGSDWKGSVNIGHRVQWEDTQTSSDVTRVECPAIIVKTEGCEGVPTATATNSAGPTKAPETPGGTVSGAEALGYKMMFVFTTLAVALLGTISNITITKRGFFSHLHNDILKSGIKTNIFLPWNKKTRILGSFAILNLQTPTSKFSNGTGASYPCLRYNANPAANPVTYNKTKFSATNVIKTKTIAECENAVNLDYCYVNEPFPPSTTWIIEKYDTSFETFLELMPTSIKNHPQTNFIFQMKKYVTPYTYRIRSQQNPKVCLASLEFSPFFRVIARILMPVKKKTGTYNVLKCNSFPFMLLTLFTSEMNDFDNNNRESKTLKPTYSVKAQSLTMFGGPCVSVVRGNSNIISIGIDNCNAPLEKASLSWNLLPSNAKKDDEVNRG